MTFSTPISTARQFRLVLTLIARRFVHRISSGLRFKRKARDLPIGRAHERRATPKKGGIAILLLGRAHERRATPKKGGIAILLLLLLVSPSWMLAAYSSAKRLIGISISAQHIRLSIPASVGDVLSDLALEPAPSPPPDEAAAENATEANRKRIYDALASEARNANWNQAERWQRATDILTEFERSGVRGFRVDDPLVGSIRTVFDEPWPERKYEDSALRTLGLVLTIFYAMLFVLSLAAAAADFGTLPGHFEWLFTLPARAGALFSSRLLGYALLNPTLWIIALPFHLALFFARGFGSTAWWLSIAATLAMSTVIGALRLMVEMRFTSRGTRPRNAQAFISILGSIGFIGFIWLSNRASLPLCLTRLGAHWPLYLHPAAAVTLLLRANPNVLVLVGAQFLGAFLVSVAAVRFARSKIATGLRGGSGEFAGERKKRSLRNGELGAAGMRLTESAPRAPLTVAIWKDARMLLRERTTLAQVMLLPIVLVISQLAVNQRTLSGVGSSANHAAALAFGIGAYMLIFGAARAFAAEGPALWLQFGFPQPLHRNLRGVTTVWAIVAAIYSGCAFVTFGFQGDEMGLEWIPLGMLVIGGVAIHAYIAAAIGALGSDPLEADGRKRVPPSTLYLYMFVATLFGKALYDPSWWSKCVQILLTTLLALALWQKLGERLPYMLDPVDSPPTRIGVVEGLLAALGFFVLQGVLMILFGRHDADVLRSLVLAYSFAGIVIALLSCYLLHHHKVVDWTRIVGFERPQGHPSGAQGLVGTLKDLVLGVAAGGVAGAFGVVYLKSVRNLPSMADSIDASDFSTAASSKLWMIGLAVFAAPLCEEFLFRGLLFRGLERALHTPRAIVFSAAIFAAIHPPLSVAPVFVLGLATALVFARSGLLFASVLTHATYNAIVIIAQTKM